LPPQHKKSQENHVSVTMVDLDGESIIESASNRDYDLLDDQDDSDFSVDGLGNKVEKIVVVEVIEQLKNKPSSVKKIHDDTDLH